MIILEWWDAWEAWWKAFWYDHPVLFVAMVVASFVLVWYQHGRKP